jgi:large subunit ribosomal protein L15
MDGARSRSGWTSRGQTGGGVPFWRLLPKRGFSNAPFKTVYSIVNVARLNVFEDGSVVTPEALCAAGVLSKLSPDGVKILGNGELSRSLTVRANAFSRSAVEKIQAAGGTVEVIPGAKPPTRNKMRSSEPGSSV